METKYDGFDLEMEWIPLEDEELEEDGENE